MREIIKRDRRSLSSAQTTSKAEAQRRVTRFVLLEISDRMSAGEPVRIRDREGRVFWLVPVMLAIPHEASRKVGAILVDTVTGELHATETVVAKINAEAERLAELLVPA